MSSHSTGQTPEETPDDVMNPPEISHDGEARRGGDRKMSDHMGAEEDEPTPVVPPMERGIDGEDDGVEIDPREELTGG